MKKRNNSKGNNGKFDFHFVIPKTESIKKFIDEAETSDRSLVAQFRRILDERYGDGK